ncbi:probable integrase/recombinase protein [Thiobacillus denitrificans ATCC 25259]|uniref:Probable integrase/recombinase protein n=1 Tax=Thiobacillus denitrificans (strain ATCC 25259 / T1) TaxID=292415 RepID=Q3SJ96_THIDA|nr:probable integrase/recombinase protein [Thiobacillus denitrificans ATCC 25259]
MSLSRHRARRAKPRVTRYLDRGLWQEVTTYIEALPKESERERDHYFRIRWLFTLLYLGGLRISEVVENSMGDFFSRRDRDGEERWWLEVRGKGGKERLVPATKEMMIELTRYRREKGLPPYPGSGEKTPLVLPIGKSHEPLTRTSPWMSMRWGYWQATASTGWICCIWSLSERPSSKWPTSTSPGLSVSQ